MRKLIDEAIRAGKQAVAEAEVSRAEALERDRPAAALLCLGHVPGDPDRLADALQTRAAKLRDGRALFLVDAATAPAFTKPGRLIECVPSTDELICARGETDSAARYRTRRLALLLEKWRVRECTALGAEAKTLLAPLSDLTEIRAGLP